MSYSDKVIDHYNNPRNVGSMDKNSTEVGTGLVGAPGVRRRDEAADQGQSARPTSLKTPSSRPSAAAPRSPRPRSPPSGSRARRWTKLCHQEHRDREGAVASSGEDPLLGAGGRRHPRRDRRLEEEAGESTQPVAAERK